MRLPAPVAGDPTRVTVNVTWGRIQPMRLHEVETIGEMELIEHLQVELPLIDTRSTESFAIATIAGARLIPFGEIAGTYARSIFDRLRNPSTRPLDRLADLTPASRTVMTISSSQQAGSIL